MILVTAATLPVVLPLLSNREVDEAARILQSALAKARDNAIRNNAPRGIRLIPDVSFNGGTNPLAYNQIVFIEPAADYKEGRVSQGVLPPEVDPNNASALTSYLGAGYELYAAYACSVHEAKLDPITGAVNPSTGWYWNIRQGDKIRFGNSGRLYTIAGPMRVLNPSRFINYDLPGSPFVSLPQIPALGFTPSEFLLLVDGEDNTTTIQSGPPITLPRNGFIDEGFDGVDNDGDGIVDPGFNGVDDNGDGLVDDPLEILLNQGIESENDVLAAPPTSSVSAYYSGVPYTIYRRPVVSERQDAINLPSGVVVDATTWDAHRYSTPAGNQVFAPERSRLPVDPFTGYVDIMIAPNGAVVPATPGQASASSAAPYSLLPFYHFWLNDRDDVYPPPFTGGGPFQVPNGSPYLLPMPQGTPGYAGTNILRRDRRLVTLFTRTGEVVVNSIEYFNASATTPIQTIQPQNAIQPYLEAQVGVKEQQ